MLKLLKLTLAGLFVLAAFGCSGGAEAEAPVKSQVDSGPPATGPDGKELTPQAASGAAGAGNTGGGAAAGSMTMPPPPTK